jgi:hypothetical protein
MVQAIFGLIQVMGMMYSKGKPTTKSDSVIEDKNTIFFEITMIVEDMNTNIAKGKNIDIGGKYI